MRRAIITLTIGAEYEAGWNALSAPGWRAYATRHCYDLLAINQPLDTSARAASRSPAWQKLLTLRPEVCGSYDRVVWLDSDIVINPEAPDVAAGVPLEKIGAVDEYMFPGHQPQLMKMIDWSLKQAPESEPIWRSYNNPSDYHAYWGLPNGMKHIVQTGVMVMSPIYHRDIFEDVYQNYDQKRGVELNYEQRPLSFEIQKRDLQHWIDLRFNALTMLRLYEYEQELKQKVSNRVELVAAIRHMYNKNYFLHFAGVQPLQRLTREALSSAPLRPGPFSSWFKQPTH